VNSLGLKNNPGDRIHPWGVRAEKLVTYLHLW
jgi:hypothetical protein